MPHALCIRRGKIFLVKNLQAIAVCQSSKVQNRCNQAPTDYMCIRTTYEIIRCLFGCGCPASKLASATNYILCGYTQPYNRHQFAVGTNPAVKQTTLHCAVTTKAVSTTSPPMRGLAKWEMLEDVLYNRLEQIRPALIYMSMTAH